MASNKKIGSSAKRPYTLRARARRKAEVHHRITLATVYLHGTVGPARTTVREIAKIAGVRRATVYNHFPTDRDLLDACSSHWFAENPPPDPAPWTAIADPRERTDVALTAMYAYYERGREMLEKVIRDAPLVPALADILQEKWVPLMEAITGILAVGRDVPEDGVREEAESGTTRPSDGATSLRATLRVALDFGTWQTLMASGLSGAEAARLSAQWVEAGRIQMSRSDASDR